MYDERLISFNERINDHWREINHKVMCKVRNEISANYNCKNKVIPHLMSSYT